MIKINQGIGNEIVRFFLFVLLGVIMEGAFLYGTFLFAFRGIGWISKFFGIIVFAVALFWGCLTWSIFNITAAVTLSETGVCCRALFVKHRCRWADIPAAGVLRLKNTKLGEYYELVLRKPIGVLEQEIPSELGMWDDWKWIHLSNTPQIREFVEKYYGPLDFDYAK